VAVALRRRNLWAWLHGCAPAEPRRVRLERLRLRALMLWLQHPAEQRFATHDHALADHPTTHSGPVARSYANRNS
jgi:hypothetical protein